MFSRIPGQLSNQAIERELWRLRDRGIIADYELDADGFWWLLLDSLRRLTASEVTTFIMAQEDFR